jgi:type IV secretion system protein VirD4
MKPMYRLPKDPGHIGGYYLAPTVAGLLCLLTSNVAATQYVANHFEYQDALGEPLWHMGTVGIYQPFAWVSWVWRYGSSVEPAIRNPLLLAAFIVIAGAFVTGVLFFLLNIQHTRQLSKDTEDLHGSARWATKGDIEATGLVDAKQGVYVGGWYDEGTRHLHYLRHNGPENVLAFAPTRSGKGVGLVIPSLLAWSESAIIYDIKGENWAKTAGFRAHAGHVCLKFSPVEESGGAHFNPLAEVRTFTPFDVSDAQNIAEMIVHTGQENLLDPHWQLSGASLATGMILHVCYAAAAQGRTATLAELAGTLTRPGIPFRDTLQELLNYPHDVRRVCDWHMPTGERTATHPAVRDKAQEMLDKEDKELSGVLSAAKTALALYCDPLVAKNTSRSDFKIIDLVESEKPISLYLVVPPAHKDRLRPLMRLIFTMIIHRLTEKMEFQGSEQRPHKHRLLLMIDEFPSLKKLEVFSDALSYMAGFGLKAYLITQDIRQIIEEYGPNESVVSNCQVRVAFAPNQYETAELLSKMAGTKTIQKASFTYSGSRMSPMMNHVNESVEQIQRPLMTPDEVMRIRPAQKKGEGDMQRIVAPGDMLIFVSGQYPILGKQMLYFSDPVLRMRSEMPPPKGSSQIASDEGSPNSKNLTPPARKKTTSETPSSGGQDREYVLPRSHEVSLFGEGHVPAVGPAADEIPVHEPLSSLSQVTPRNVEQLDLWMDR